MLRIASVGINPRQLLYTDRLPAYSPEQHQRLKGLASVVLRSKRQQGDIDSIITGLQPGYSLAMAEAATESGIPLVVATPGRIEEFARRFNDRTRGHMLDLLGRANVRDVYEILPDEDADIITTYGRDIGAILAEGNQRGLVSALMQDERPIIQAIRATAPNAEIDYSPWSAWEKHALRGVEPVQQQPARQQPVTRAVRQDSERWENPPGNQNWQREWFSNMHPFSQPVIHEGVTYTHPEIMYHALKSSSSDERARLAAFTNPFEAKKQYRNIITMPEGFDTREAMLQTTRIRAQQDPAFRDRLLSTGDQPLVEWNRHGDQYWGADAQTGVGQNNLGKIMMQVRNELRQQQPAPPVPQAGAEPRIAQVTANLALPNQQPIAAVRSEPEPRIANVGSTPDIGESLYRTFDRQMANDYYGEPVEIQTFTDDRGRPSIYAAIHDVGSLPRGDINIVQSREGGLISNATSYEELRDLGYGRYDLVAIDEYGDQDIVHLYREPERFRQLRTNNAHAEALIDMLNEDGKLLRAYHDPDFERKLSVLEQQMDEVDRQWQAGILRNPLEVEYQPVYENFVRGY
jgi:hypothetical protein